MTLRGQVRFIISIILHKNNFLPNTQKSTGNCFHTHLQYAYVTTVHNHAYTCVPSKQIKKQLYSLCHIQTLRKVLKVLLFPAQWAISLNIFITGVAQATRLALCMTPLVPSERVTNKSFCVGVCLRVCEYVLGGCLSY